MAAPVVSNHRILGRIGAGGMGQVYLAEDLDLHRKVALKFLSDEFFHDEEQRARFLREARHAAALNHPNICTVYSVGRVPSDIVPIEGDSTVLRTGTPFLAMELVEGRTLVELIRDESPLPTDRLLDLSTQIAEGLAEAHRRGIVHRDLKPGNIMLTGSGRIKILDFGLAKALDRAADEEIGLEDPTLLNSDPLADLTREQAILGTPAYMSPEQAAGRKIDLRSDVFSLGLILTELATGEKVFSAPSAMAVMAKIIETEVSPLERADLPRDFVRTVDRCLRKDAAERFASGEEALNALRSGVETEPTASVTAPRASNSLLGRRFALGLVALVTLGAIGYFGLRGSRDPRSASPVGATTLAVLPFAHIGEPGKEYVARGITEEVTSRLSLLRELDVISSSSAAQYAGESPEEAAAALGVDYVLDGHVQWAGASLQIRCELSRPDGFLQWSQTFDGSPDSLFALQSRLAEAVALELDQFLEPLRSRPTDSGEAYDAYLQGLEAVGASLDPNAVREAIGDFARAAAADSTFALAWARLSMALSWEQWAGFTAEPERMALSLRSARRALDLDPQLPEAHLALGYYHYRSGLQYGEALREFQTARQGKPGDSDLLLAIGAVLRRQGDVADALAYFEQAAHLDPRSAYKTWETGETLALLRRFAEAEHRFESALRLDSSARYASNALAELELLGRGEPSRARVHLEEPLDSDGVWLLMASYIFEGNLDEARQVLATHDFGHEVPEYVFRLWIHQLEGDRAALAAAADELRNVLERDHALLGADPNVASLLGLAYAGLGDADAARRHGREAVRSAAGDAMTEAETRTQLAWIYTLIGDDTAAMDELESLLEQPSLVTRARLRIDPTFAQLRETERFRAALSEPSS